MYVNFFLITLDKIAYYYFPYSYGLIRFLTNTVYYLSYYTVIPTSKMIYYSSKKLYNYTFND